ncbi:hypothetical protein CHLNCDRAFT_133261 [Chlorella variabilis]|uniref:GH16 domain-containing protein n=1 Tax=Chlorella variabilis TaxID=554065 RepID=E1Z2Q7_CHLVA|nr:hypothetical protein CHLNCDRAFT_133261 [Chlorella variabilis]EFN59705.1 hypothetical protein CHLNCDRAFT_133261 [Chlorella variabilis]|eukprot:XP_005851807.1 hypothetical protein CHLNCDRAFT_133261 [Chlorella variabilis]
MAATHTAQAYSVDARGGPTFKTWSEDVETLSHGVHKGPTCCVRFKFAIWLLTVAALVAAGVGLSVIMVIVQNNRNDNAPPGPPPPPPPPLDPEGGSGSNSGGGGNTGPLPVPPSPAPFDVPPGSQAIWWDEFDGDTLDTDKWSYDLGNGVWGWGNNEVETYTDSPDNVWVADGNLYITALRDGDAFTSGRINTKAHAGFYPGMQLEDGTTFASLHVEARMQLPTPGQGLWPAFWMFPTEPTYGEWAASGEIDVMESINEMTTITQGLQYGGTAPENQKSMLRTRQEGKVPYSDGFHTMAVDWSAGRITLSVDGVESGTFLPREKDPAGWWTSDQSAPPDAPFNQPFYLILNLAVGGLWPDPPDSTTPFPATFAVDYVRVWGEPV